MIFLDKLKELGSYNPFDNKLPTQEDIVSLENQLDIILPDSYKKYLLEYSNIYFGGFELLKPFQDNGYLDMFKVMHLIMKWCIGRIMVFLMKNGVIS